MFPQELNYFAELSRKTVWSFKQLLFVVFTIWLRAWYFPWMVVLRLIYGRHLRNKFLELHHKIHTVVKLLPFRLRDRVFYRVARFLGDFVQTKLPDGILIQPRDNLPINDHIYTRKTYNRIHEIQKDDVIIDVGAHVGVFTLRAARRAVNGLVIAVEPHPTNYKFLTENVRFNKLKNVITLNLALSNYEGVANLYESKEQSGMHSIILRRSDKFVKVSVKTLDKMVEELKIEKVDMIKIDVEGAELDVLKGAEDTLKKNNVHLAIESAHTPTGAQGLSKFLQDRGFKVLTFRDNWSLWPFSRYSCQHMCAWKPHSKTRSL